MERSILFKGPIIHSVIREKVTILENGALVIKQGQIYALEIIENESQMEDLLKKFNPFEVITLKKGQFLIPGFFDTHTHASQFPNMGLGYDKKLLDWLGSYTFPLESKFKDPEVAMNIYTDVVKTTLSCGTTSAVYFATTHLESSLMLAKVAHKFQQRAWVGKVNMDTNSPPELKEDSAKSVLDTVSFIHSVNALNNDNVRPIITPRFALSCTPGLQVQLAILAAKHDLHIQTHLCENKEEIQLVADVYADRQSYTQIYQSCKLLTRKTILAHCVHLEDSEVELIKAAGSSVAHCPSSNVNLKSGLCDVRRLLNAGINVSLGTDVSGGSSPSILDAIRSAMNTSISISFERPPNYSPITYHEAFYMATVGGAIALNKQDELGNFTPGKKFDALLVTMNASENSVSEMFQKFIYTGDSKAITNVYINGEVVTI